MSSESPKSFYRDEDTSSTSSSMQKEKHDQEILELARQFTNQANQNQQQHAEDESGDPEKYFEPLSRRISRATSIVSVSTAVNPFIDAQDTILDPYNEHFNARQWTKHMLKLQQKDPERYPLRTAGVSFKNLSAYGYSQGSDYQKTVGNIVLSLGSMTRSLMGHKGDHVDILRNFNGLLKEGETCVVLGRPGS